MRVKILVLMTGVAALLFLLSYSSTVPDTPEHQLATLVAKAYGVDSIPRIGRIRYTFNVAFDGKQKSRSWIWSPAEDKVTFKDPDSSAAITYLRKSVSEQEELKKIDAQFINDQYWFLFPLHLVWDSDVSLSLARDRHVPIGEGVMNCLTLTYPPGKGYTPGDAYDIYIDSKYRIAQWVYRKGNAASASRVVKWEEYKTAGPLMFSLYRPGTDEKFQVRFTDVAVQRKGSEDWITPK
jgi:hypothetical protein